MKYSIPCLLHHKDWHEQAARQDSVLAQRALVAHRAEELDVALPWTLELACTVDEGHVRGVGVYKMIQHSSCLAFEPVKHPQVQAILDCWTFKLSE